MLDWLVMVVGNGVVGGCWKVVGDLFYVCSEMVFGVVVDKDW